MIWLSYFSDLELKDKEPSSTTGPVDHTVTLEQPLDNGSAAALLKDMHISHKPIFVFDPKMMANYKKTLRVFQAEADTRKVTLNTRPADLYVHIYMYIYIPIGLHTKVNSSTT